MKHVIVIGGGPAGLFAAIGAAFSGAQVRLLEKLPSPGRKLLASGNGKCNIGNICTPEELAEAFGREGRFLIPALRHFPPQAEQQWFADRGVPWKLTDGFHYFPATERASDILNALLKELGLLHVEILCSCMAEQLLVSGQRIMGVRCAGNRTLESDAVVLASGGRGYPALGGSNSGYKLAQSAGHTITPILPAMTGLCTREAWVGECAGISLKDCICSIALPKEKSGKRGELLFTQKGISAFAVLDLAGRVSELLLKHETVPVTLDLTPEKSAEAWKAEFARLRQKEGRKTVLRILADTFPRRLALELAGVFAELPVSRLPGEGTAQLCRNITALPLQICAVEGWEKAMVTRGGIRLKEIRPETLESRLVSGLHFAGEVVDLDGPCGGYNLTWAVASGMLAGFSAAN